ncbi:hypothetical protein [Myxococcus xanthus]|uniref:Lipoprotein n=1 Tax=Myxococcus xanthus TaxID=34 RepID=A0A7Y4IQX5_MYXXA|nr:hypothetical protein [Myxococcus xanthus]NOJ83095.1 hypothetical protein [Myxococcus xanthus]NOJ88871.1 hypothetical protein [Myxococcus xanthus]
MSIKLTGRLMAAALLSLTAAGCQGEESQPAEADALSAQEAPVKQQCVETFAGITNCATGNAKLERTEAGLNVTGLEKAVNDGVSSNFAAATQWEQKAVFQELAKAGQGFALAARDGDQVVSTLQVGIGREPGQVTFQPQFTGTPGGSTYSVYVYNGGQFQGRHINRGLWFPMDASWYDIHIRFTPIHIGFRNHMTFGFNDPIPTGACVWSFRSATPGAFTFDFDGREVSGDHVEFVEELGDGHYPYTSFSAIDLTAAASALTIHSESISRGK